MAISNRVSFKKKSEDNFSFKGSTDLSIDNIYRGVLVVGGAGGVKYKMLVSDLLGKLK